ncbi:hypothetical protein KY308_02985 [Candidatus Woesearchaeota archaeon]|nr:hypothetical protein [Candidatus Woesearchaeota archaeon]
MVLGKAITYLTLCALSFGAGYATNYYMQNKETHYTIGVGQGNWGIRKTEGINESVEDTVDSIKKKTGEAQETVEDFVDDVGKKIKSK